MLQGKIFRYIFFAFVLFSCVKSTITKTGFEMNFVSNSSGLSILTPVNDDSPVVLKGAITIREGALSVKLTNPDGVVVYAKVFEDQGFYEINEFYRMIQGSWKLSFKSLQGRGAISLHALN
jgi:filamentous hemagglutinin family protein